MCAASLRDHFAEAAMAQSFKAYAGQPLIIPAEAAAPKAAYLAWHRTHIFSRKA